MKFSPYMPALSAQEKQNLMLQTIRNLSKIRGIVAVILFGSQATGKARPDSDVDLAIITKNDSEREKIKVICEGNEVIQISHFNTLPIEIQFRIIKEGKVIFCKNKEELKKRKIATILKYLDFNYFLTKFYQRKLENV